MAALWARSSFMGTAGNCLCAPSALVLQCGCVYCALMLCVLMHSLHAGVPAACISYWVCFCATASLLSLLFRVRRVQATGCTGLLSNGTTTITHSRKGHSARWAGRLMPRAKRHSLSTSLACTSYKSRHLLKIAYVYVHERSGFHDRTGF